MEITKELLFKRKEWMLNKNFSVNTMQNYESDVNLFLNYLRLKKGVYTITTEKITLTAIEEWKTYLRETPTPRNSIYYTVRPTLSQATIQSKLTAIKSLLKYVNLFYNTGLDYKKIENKKIKSDYVEYLTDAEFLHLKNFIGDYEKYKINALRMQLLVNIGFTSWLRLSEMLGLTIGEVKKKETRINGKWNKVRRVFFSNSTEELLDEYLYQREQPIPWTWKVENKSDFVFISHNSWYDFGHPISPNTVCEKMKTYSDGMHIGKRITVHSLRHSYATKLIESWMNIREIQELLWHKDIQTTEWYIHLLKSNLSKKVNQIFN